MKTNSLLIGRRSLSIWYLVLIILLDSFSSCHGQRCPNNSVTIPKVTGEARIKRLRGAAASIAIGNTMQDKTGKIWFCSNGAGIFRYDGNSFTNFTVKDGLDNNIVYSILEDKSGTIWVGTQSGLNRYDGKVFSAVPLSSGDKATAFPGLAVNKYSTVKNRVWTIMQDRSGIIWFGTDEGVYRFDGKIFSSFLNDKNIINPASLQLKATFSILEDKDGIFWFGTCVREGICRYDGKHLTNFEPERDLGRVNQIIQCHNGNILVMTTKSHICRYDGKAFTKNIFNNRIGDFGLMVEDKAGDIWFESRKGLSRYDGKRLKVITAKDSIPAEALTPVFKDKSGNMWLSSPGLGLYQYDGKAFRPFSE